MVEKKQYIDIVDDLEWALKVISATGNLSRANISKNSAHNNLIRQSAEMHEILTFDFENVAYIRWYVLCSE